MTRNYERIYRPQALGFRMPVEELFGGACKEDAARIFDNILTGHATPAQTQCVIVNAAFAIQVMEPQKEIEECIAIARESLDSGRALATLKNLSRLINEAMKDILSEIITHKQTEIELQKQTVSLEQLQEQAGIIIRENAAHHRSMKQALLLLLQESSPSSNAVHPPKAG